MLAIIATLFVIAAIYVLNFYRKVSQYPPGPRPWPLVGNLFQLPLSDTHKFITKMKDIYGPVYTVWQPQPVVYIQDYDLIKDAFITHGDDYLGRPGKYPDNVFQLLPSTGVIHSQGDAWKEERRTALHILRDFGMGKNAMEEQVRISTQDCIEHIKSLPDKNHVDVRWPIQLLVGNVINRVLFGYHYKYNDCERMKTFCDLLNVLIIGRRTTRLTSLMFKFPWIKYVPVIGTRAYYKFIEVRDRLYAHVTKDIEKTLKEFSPESEAETFTQAYVQRTKKDGTFKIERVQNMCMDFFLAGSETTSTSLRWACIIMAKNPEVQEKLRREIFDKLGQDKFVTMKDRANMPYCSAAIMELQRVANILPFNVTHRTTVDTVCGKFKIPADTQVQGMINTVMSQDPHFERPDEFRPERFLERDGKTFKKELVERVIPFSIGKRMCAGEGLARMELFMGLVSLLQNFRIKPPIDGPLETRGTFGGVMIPPSNNFVIEVL